MAKHATGDLRNIVLAGHGASGKTTLADAMLFKSGVGTRAGSVDDGTSVFDFEDDEKERKHSITSALGHCTFQGTRINIIDAPGYPDFVGQVVGAIHATETAVIAVSGVHGIAVNTRKTFHLAGNAGVARMIVITKLDGENINFDALVESIRTTFGSACALMNVPVGLGNKLSGVVSTITPPANIPADVATDPKVANQQVLDAVVEADEELMARYLEGETLGTEEVEAAIKKAILAGSLIPIFCVSARKDIGISEFLNGIVHYAPSPLALKRKLVKSDGTEAELNLTPEAPALIQVFKTRIDPFLSRMSFLRVWNGTLKKDASLMNLRAGKAVKLHQMIDLQGSHHDALDSAVPGDLLAVVKVDDLRLGDTLSANNDGAAIPFPKFPTPMIGLAVKPKSQADQQKISGALHKFEEEDPTFVVVRDSQTKEMVMRGLSELHLQIIENRLRKREKVDVITQQPKVPYRETVAGAAEGSYRHKKQSGGAGQFAEVHLRVAALPHNIDPKTYFTKDRFLSLREFHYDPALNYCFVDRVSGGSVPNQFIPAVEKGVKERMEMGVIANCQVQDVSVELFFGKDHPVDSNENAFKTAARQGFKEIFLKAKPVLLEPIVKLEITAPSEKLGEITSDLNSRRGRMDGMDNAGGGFQVIRAHAPLAEVMTYARALSSMTGGQGSFSLEFSHYDIVPPNEQAKIVAAAVKHEEEE